MKRLLLFFLTCLFAGGLVAQTPGIVLQNTIGGSGSEEYSAYARPAVGGGYFLAGSSDSNISGDKSENSRGGKDYWVMKLDGSLNIVWQRTLGGSASDYLYDVQATPDGGCIVGGTSGSGLSGDKTEGNYGEEDIWVLKLDAAGNIQWQNTIGGNSDEGLRSLQPTADGGYILGGTSNSGIGTDKTEPSRGGYDYWVVKLNANGAVIWDKTIGGGSADIAWAIRQTGDGGYFIGGESTSNASGDKTENSRGQNDYWVLKLNATGGIVWQRTLGSAQWEWFRNLDATTDGGCIIAGDTDGDISGDKTEASMMHDIWVLKLDATGNIQWQNTINGNAYDECGAIKQLPNGNYVVAGYSNSGIAGDKTDPRVGGGSGGQSDFWVIGLLADGSVQWDAAFGGSSGEYADSVWPTGDGGFVVAGTSVSNISGDKTENAIGADDYWVLKLSNPYCTWYPDTDGDGYGETTDPQFTCDQPTGYVYATGDCNDANANIHPFASETCNGIDENCNEILDDGNALAVTFTYTKPACPGDSDGSIRANPGGTGASYQWSTGSSARTITGLAAGQYTATVTNAQGCSGFATAILLDPTALKVTFTKTHPHCNAPESGTLTANASGGTGTKTYLWNTGATTKTITGLAAGSYTVTVTDSKGCSKIETTDLYLNVPLIDPAVYPTGNTWKIVLFAAGGKKPYKYRKCTIGGTCTAWQTGRTFTGVTAGTYTFEVMDANGCTASEIVDLSNSRPADSRLQTADFEPSAHVFPNPASTLAWADLSEMTGETFSLRLVSASGSVVRQLESVGAAETVQIDVQGLASGLYFLEITSETGERTVEKLTIGQH